MKPNKEVTVYDKVKEFRKKYPFTLAFRTKQHSKIVQKHLNPGEIVKYAFVGQKNDNTIDTFNSYVVVLTNKRILLGRKRIIFGYFFYAITPDLFNDLKVRAGIFWGQVIIDTIKELVTISNISKSALAEIETKVTEYMMKEKERYLRRKEREIRDAA